MLSSSTRGVPRKGPGGVASTLRGFANHDRVVRQTSVSPHSSPVSGRDFHVKMWGTSSPDDKLTGDLGNVIEAAQTGRRR
jgi:hypothetical protein